MGYKLPDRTVVLEGFEGDFEGLEVVCTRNAPMSTYLELDTAWSEERRADAFKLFGDEIITGWNYEDREGNPVDPTGAELQRLPPDMAAVIVGAWMKGVTEVPAPLEQLSTNGVRETAPPIDLGNMSTQN